MQNYDYDENGLITSYLLLALLFPLFLYQIYRAVFGKRRFPCTCPGCKKQISKTKIVMLTATSVVMAILLKNIFTTSYKPKNSAFNPFETLNVTEDASPQEIKRAHRKTIFKLSKSGESNKEKKDKEAVINRAFEILKSKESYDAWFYKSKETTLIIAIPEIFVRFSKYSIFGYLVILAVVPLVSIYIHRRIRTDTQYGGSFRANELFSEAIDTFSGDYPLQKLLVFISRMPDFTAYKYKNDLTNRKGEIEDIGGIPMAVKSQSYLHIMDYLCRSGLSDSNDLVHVKRKLLGVITGYIEVSRCADRIQLFEMLLVLHKMVVQAVPAPEYIGMQYPRVTAEDVIKKREIKKDFEDLIPAVEFSPVVLEVMDEESVVLQPRGGGEYQIEPGTTVTITFSLKKKGGYEGLCHSPYAPAVPVDHRWYVYMKVDGKLEGGVYTVSSVGKERKFRQMLLVKKNKSVVRLCVVSNGYFDADANTSIGIKSC